MKHSVAFDQERLEVWKEALWAMWEEGFKLIPTNITLGSMKAMFMTGFDAGRSSFTIVPETKAKKATKAEKARKAKKARKG